MATGTKQKFQEDTGSSSNTTPYVPEGGPTSAQSNYSSASRAARRSPGTAMRRTPNGNAREDAQRADGRKMARGLAWFSISVGLANVLVPRTIAKLVGVRRKNARAIQFVGLREIASGIAIFAQGDNPAGAVWSRVAGDALDLATLGAAFQSPGTNKTKLTLATAHVAAISALDVMCARKLSNGGNGDKLLTEAGTSSIKSLIINRSPEDLYQAWKQFENLPNYINNLESVQSTEGQRSHWIAKGPAGARIEWDAEIVDDRPNERIAWSSLPGADIDHYGSIRFERATGDRGTIVKIEMNYSLPGGKIGSALAKLFGEDPSQHAMEALRRFKQVMETGEVVVSEGTLYHNGLLTQRPAQPAGDEQFERSKSTRTPRHATTPSVSPSTARTEEQHAR